MRLPHLLVALASTLTISPASADEPPVGRRPFDAQPDVPAAPAAAPAAAAPSVLTPIPARLDYARGPGAEACPDEEGLRSSVAANVGHDPFVADAPRRLIARIVRERGRFVAYLEIREDGGAVTWSRPPIPDADCRGLVRVMGLSIAIKIDPLPTPLQVPAAPAAPPPVIVVMPPPVAEPRRDEAVAPPAPASARPRFRAGLGAAVDVGLTPGAAAALSMHVGVRWPYFSLSAEGRGLLPVTADVGTHGARARVWALAGSLVPCGHIPLPIDKWNVAACGVLTLGAAHGEPVAAVAVPSTGSSVYARTGAELALEFHVGGPVLLRVGGDLLAVLRPVSLLVSTKDFPAGTVTSSTETWTGGRFAAAFGGGVVADF
jgi:hypothetical protein